MHSLEVKPQKYADSREAITEVAVSLGLSDAIRERAINFFDRSYMMASRMRNNARLIAAVSLYISELVEVAEKVLAEDPSIPTKGLPLSVLDRFKVKPNKSLIIKAFGMNQAISLDFSTVYVWVFPTLGINEDLVKIIKKSSDLLRRDF